MSVNSNKSRPVKRDRQSQVGKVTPEADEHYIGLLSGTSRDGVDAVLVNFNNNRMDILHATCVPYPSAIRQKLDQLIATRQAPGNDAASWLDDNLGRFFARTAQNLVRETGMEMRDINAIGSHGQTVWHEPDGDTPVSIQLGKPALIARGTQCTVVADFRSADIQAGGQGAPLAPLIHLELFANKLEDRAILNLGGIANLTFLPASGGVSGYDCGPGNCLMDAWTLLHLHTDYDESGRWASKGQVNDELLKCLLDDPYFNLTPPKSTGLEYFNLPWLEQKLTNTDIPEVDVQTTLAELTVQSIASSLKQSNLPARVMVCGGGVHNTFLMRRLATVLPDLVVESTGRYGADPDWVEGLLFAWLARERVAGRSQNTPPITGASQAVLLGNIFEP